VRADRGEGRRVVHRVHAGAELQRLLLGPHVPSTKRLKAFKLLSVSGAYFKGDQTRQQLQRIYGTSFFTQKDLEEYLNKLERQAA